MLNSVSGVADCLFAVEDNFRIVGFVELNEPRTQDGILALVSQQLISVTLTRVHKMMHPCCSSNPG
jgi:hypothetical protein